MGASPPPGTWKLQLTAAKSPHQHPQSSTGSPVSYSCHTRASEGDSREAARGALKLDHMHLNPSGAIVASVSPSVKRGITRTPTSWDPFADETRRFLHRALGFPKGNLKGAKERVHKASHSMAHSSWTVHLMGGWIQKPFQDPPTQR